MGYEAKKTEHAGAKHGNGAYWGPKKDAKKESNKIRRRNAKREVAEAEPDPMELLASLREQIGKPEKKYRIVKAISQSTEQFQTGRYEGPED